MLNKDFYRGNEYIHRYIRIDRGHDYNLPNSTTNFHLTSSPIDEINERAPLQGSPFTKSNRNKHVTRQSKKSC